MKFNEIQTAKTSLLICELIAGKSHAMACIRAELAIAKGVDEKFGFLGVSEEKIRSLVGQRWDAITEALDLRMPVRPDGI